LRLHSVLAGAVKGFDPQVLLDPFERVLRRNSLRRMIGPLW
jgi:hypothetical protein